MDDPVTFEDLLQEAINTFRERRATYGDSIDKFGDVMRALFPQGLTIISKEEWARFGLFMQLVHKITRYTNAYATPHQDSMHDLGVYAFLLQELDLRQSKGSARDPV